MLVLTPLGRHHSLVTLRSFFTALLATSVVSLGLLNGPVQAETAAVSVGQLDLPTLGFAPVAVATTDMAIGSSDFAVAALIAQATDPDLSALLANVGSFSLRQYAPPDAAVIAAAQALIPAIESEGWQLVRAETQGTRQVTVHTMADGAIIAGLTVIAIDVEREVSIANIVGDIQPTQLTTLGLPIPQ